MSRARRTEILNADFIDGYAHGWCFGVHEAFRAALDISLDTRMDTAANQALAHQLGRKLHSSERITRTVWTQGHPPAYAFSRGQLMHEPASVHAMSWAQALPLLRRSIMILDAAPDVGAQPDPLQNTAALQPEDERENGAALPQPTPGLSIDAPTVSGWVDIELYYYANGRITRRDRHRLSQSELVQLLREGALPPDKQN